MICMPPDQRFEAETELAIHRIAEHVRKVLAKAPQLSNEQQRLSELFRGPHVSQAEGSRVELDAVTVTRPEPLTDDRTWHPTSCHWSDPWSKESANSPECSA